MKNYGQLKTEIAAWTDREDAAFTARVPLFIRLAETEIYRDLRVRDNEFSVVYTAQANPINPIQLPDNYREMKLVTAGTYPFELGVTDPILYGTTITGGTPLTRISDQHYNFRRSRGAPTGDAEHFTVIDRELYIFPWGEENIDPAESEAAIGCLYYGTESLGDMAIWNTIQNPVKVPSDDGTPSTTTERTDASTTRMFLVHPDLYLHGALYYAYIWLREAPKAAEHRELFNATLGDIKYEGGESDYAGSTVQVGSTYYDGAVK